MDMNELLENLYAKEGTLPSLEKTAESRLMAELSSTQEENPFMDLSTDDLIKLASELNEPEHSDQEELEKVAMDMVGGQVMAHSMVHEFGLMKAAMVQGLCRVCKTSSMDIEGSSICSTCLSE